MGRSTKYSRVVAFLNRKIKVFMDSDKVSSDSEELWSDVHQQTVQTYPICPCIWLGGGTKNKVVMRHRRGRKDRVLYAP